MGGYLSKQKIDPNDYEKVLSELDGKIQKVEMKLSEIKLRQRRTNALVVTYSTLAWLVYITYCFLLLQQHQDYSMDIIANPIMTILVIPIGIYYTRRTLTWIYAKRHTIEEAKLASLRAHQKLKVEELKRTTSYYTTRLLLERYDSEMLKRRKQQQDRQAQTQNLHQQKPVSMPGIRCPTKNQYQRHQDPGFSSSRALPQQSYQISQKGPPQWYDKIMDALIGEEGPETKYALICNHCFTHNGLILPSELYIIEYTCPSCRKFNPARKSRQLDIHSPQTPSPSPSPSPIYFPIGKDIILSKLGIENERPLSNLDTALKKKDCTKTQKMKL